MMWDKVTKVMALTAGMVAGLFGGFDDMLIVMGAFMLIDYITGMLAGIMGKSTKTPTGHISSEIAWKGLAKKAGELVAVIVGVLMDRLAMEGLGFTAAVFRSGIILYIIATEGISILENLGAIDVPLPAFVQKALEALQKQADKDDQEGGDRPNDVKQ